MARIRREFELKEQIGALVQCCVSGWGVGSVGGEVEVKEQMAALLQCCVSVGAHTPPSPPLPPPPLLLLVPLGSDAAAEMHEKGAALDSITPHLRSSLGLSNPNAAPSQAQSSRVSSAATPQGVSLSGLLSQLPPPMSTPPVVDPVNASQRSAEALDCALQLLQVWAARKFLAMKAREAVEERQQGEKERGKEQEGGREGEGLLLARVAVAISLVRYAACNRQPGVSSGVASGADGPSPPVSSPLQSDSLSSSVYAATLEAVGSVLKELLWGEGKDASDLGLSMGDAYKEYEMLVELVVVCVWALAETGGAEGYCQTEPPSLHEQQANTQATGGTGGVFQSQLATGGTGGGGGAVALSRTPSFPPNHPEEARQLEQARQTLDLLPRNVPLARTYLHLLFGNILPNVLQATAAATAAASEAASKPKPKQKGRSGEGTEPVTLPPTVNPSQLTHAVTVLLTALQQGGGGVGAAAGGAGSGHPGWEAEWTVLIDVVDVIMVNRTAACAMARVAVAIHPLSKQLQDREAKLNPKATQKREKAQAHPTNRYAGQHTDCGGDGPEAPTYGRGHS
ncbi:unnamed protein product [Closterium sp. NIES-65]|nr:unnamed protein product [Closterium sp. NIES-65]